MPSLTQDLWILLGEISVCIGCCLFLILLWYSKHRVRYIFMVPFIGLGLFSLCLSIVPSYTQGPNSTAFFQSQGNTIITRGTKASAAYIKIITKENTITIPVQTGQTIQVLPPSQRFSIQFISPDQDSWVQAFITTKNWIILQIFPQTSLSLQGIFPNHMEVQVNNGNIAYSLFTGQEETISFVSWTQAKETQETQALESTFIQTMQANFKQQWGNPIFYAPQSIRIQKWLLDTAYKYLPQIYTTQRTNFLAFVQSIPQNNENTTSLQTDTQDADQEILNQSQRGRQETKIYQWIQDIFH